MCGDLWVMQESGSGRSRDIQLLRSCGEEGTPDCNPNYSSFYHSDRVFGGSLACNRKYCAPGLPGYTSLSMCAAAAQPCGQEHCPSEHWLQPRTGQVPLVQRPMCEKIFLPVPLFVGSCSSPWLYLCLALQHCLANPRARILSMWCSSQQGSALGQLCCLVPGLWAARMLLEAVLLMSLCRHHALPRGISLAAWE